MRRKVPNKSVGKKQDETETVRSSTSQERERTPEAAEAGGRPGKAGVGGSFRKRVGDNKENRGVAVNKARRQLSSTEDSGKVSQVNTFLTDVIIIIFCKVCSSLESVLGLSDTRVRQMSGTLSENSHSSNREVVYIKSDDQAKVSEERMVFISHSKVPFSVSSTIPYNKHSKVSRYINILLCTSYLLSSLLCFVF